MGGRLRSTHIILGFSLTAWLLIVAIDVLMHHNDVESSLLLASVDMYSYFIFVIIAGRSLPWEQAAGTVFTGEDALEGQRPGLPAGSTGVTGDKS